MSSNQHIAESHDAYHYFMESRAERPETFDCAACGHRHRGMVVAGAIARNMDRCGYAAGWDGGAPTEFCDCKDLVPEYEQED